MSGYDNESLEKDVWAMRMLVERVNDLGALRDTEDALTPQQINLMDLAADFAAMVKEALDAAEPSPRQAAGFAVELGYWLARAEMLDQTPPQRVRDTSRATAARTRTDWRTRAAQVWQEHPSWTKNRVANEIALPGDHLRAVIRAIGELVPPTSPSFKAP
jgi:hypothetical protein